MDPGLDHTLRPVSPSARYAILTDPERIQILSCKEGDVVRLSGDNNAKWNGELGIVQYIGPISNSTEICITENLTWTDRLQGNCSKDSHTKCSHIGTWFGVELITVSQSQKRSCRIDSKDIRYCNRM